MKHTRNNKRKLVLGLGAMLGLGLVGIPAYADTVTFSAVNEESLNLTLSSDTATLSLNPESTPFSTSSITATASTNSEAGYKITVTSSDTSLIRTEALSDNTVPAISTLDALSGGYTQSSFTVNRWGYNKGSGNWLPFSSPIELGSSDGPADAEQNTMNFAAKIDYTQPAGTYNITLTFVATANVPAVNAPIMQSQTAATLAELLPNVGDTITMEDSRDGGQYLVGKTADNKYWMLDNLRLGGDEPILLTSQDTNISSNFTLPADNNGTDYDVPNIVADSKNDLVTTFDGERTVKNGVYYNFCAASAGVLCEETYPLVNEEWEDDVTLYHLQADICPAGWHIPGEEEYFQIVYLDVYPVAQYDYYIDDYAAAVDAYDLYGGGYYENGSGGIIGNFGYWWSSDFYETIGARALRVAKWVTSTRTYYDLRIGGTDSNIRGDEDWSPSYIFHQVRCVFGPSIHSEQPEESVLINNRLDNPELDDDPDSGE